MNVKTTIEYLIVNAFWVYIVVRFANVFFADRKLNKMKRTIVYLSFYIINSLAYLIFLSPIINIVTSILGIFLVTCCSKANIYKKITATFLIYIICMTCDTLVATLVSKYVIGMTLGILNNILTYLLIFIVQLIIEHYINLSSEFSIHKQYLFTILVTPVSSLVIICLLVFEIKNVEITFGIAALLLLINISIFYIYDSILRHYKEHSKNIILEQQLYAYRNQLDTIAQSQDNVEGLRHDMKHHLLTLYNMVNHSTQQEVENYLNNMIGFMENVNEYSKTGNKDIDSVLNYFIQRAIYKKIQVETKLNIPPDLNVNFFDLNVILSNLWENAIFASENSTKKRIKFSLELDKNVLFIRLSNSYDGIVNIDNGQLLTRKQDDIHGYGLKNVAAITDKYNGVMDLDYNHETFFVDILLYLKSTLS